MIPRVIGPKRWLRLSSAPAIVEKISSSSSSSLQPHTNHRQQQEISIDADISRLPIHINNQQASQIFRQHVQGIGSGSWWRDFRRQMRMLPFSGIIPLTALDKLSVKWLPFWRMQDQSTGFSWLAGGNSRLADLPMELPDIRNVSNNNDSEDNFNGSQQLSSSDDGVQQPFDCSPAASDASLISKYYQQVYAANYRSALMDCGVENSDNERITSFITPTSSITPVYIPYYTVDCRLAGSPLSTRQFTIYINAHDGSIIHGYRPLSVWSTAIVSSAVSSSGLAVFLTTNAGAVNQQAFAQIAFALITAVPVYIVWLSNRRLWRCRQQLMRDKHRMINNPTGHRDAEREHAVDNNRNYNGPFTPIQMELIRRKSQLDVAVRFASSEWNRMVANRQLSECIQQWKSL
jgi:hypothetical protein